MNFNEVLAQAMSAPPVAPRAARHALLPGADPLNSAADLLVPSRGIVLPRKRRLVERTLSLPREARNAKLRDLVSADTHYGEVPHHGRVAARVAKAIGQKRSKRLGFGVASSGVFVGRVIRADNGKLLKRLGPVAEDAMAIFVSDQITNATRQIGQKRVLDGEALLAQMVGAQQAIGPAFPTRALDLAGVAAAAQRLPLAVRAGLIDPVAIRDADPRTGSALGAGIPLLTSRALMNPRGRLNAWLGRTPLRRI